jgi:hypothetical protein
MFHGVSSLLSKEHSSDRTPAPTTSSKIIIEIMVFALAKRRNAGYSYRHNDYRDKQFAATAPAHLTITGEST